ncbi:MAG: hypothetical protein JNM51_17540 [Bacteroidia bacterium]|nr:hypothetical protein [Bacteroidia bacterium]
MTNKIKYALISLMTFALSVVLLLYGILALGLFSSNKIIVSTLATTGPDYNVSFGQFKLARLMPDSIKSSDVSGIMVTDESAINIDRYLIDTDDFDNYYLLTFKMVGVQKSDSYSYHPLLKIISCRQINFLLLWTLIIMEFGLIVLFSLFYKKHKRQISSS